MTINKYQLKALLRTATIQLASSLFVGVVFFALSKNWEGSLIIGIAVFLYTLRGLYRDYIALRHKDNGESGTG